MSMNRFPEVAQFLGCYLHQDWNDEFPNWKAAVTAYLAGAVKEDVTKALQELDALASVVETTDDPEELLRQLGCYFDPTSEGMTVRAWLGLLKGELSLAVQ